MIEQPDTWQSDAQSAMQPTTQIQGTGQPAPATPSQKLVLPAVPTVPPVPPPNSGPLPPPMYTNPRVQVPPGMLIRQNTPPPPRSPFAKLVYFWRKDPAYKVLMIAVALVVVAAIVLTSLVSHALLHSSPPQNSTVVQNPSGTVQPNGTVDDKPTFPTPGGGNGSTVTSQPPPQSTPVIQPTQPPQPGPTQPAGGLTVQITNIPGHVRNFSSANVTVNTSEANVQVVLVIYYTAAPYRSSAGPVMSGADGSANLHWYVSVFAMGKQNVTATVYAVARDQNGQTARSQAAIIQITTQGGGGGA